MPDEPTTVYRVTVRGRFAELTEPARRYLTRTQAEHDVFLSAYTQEGTFTYDAAILFFNLRYERRGCGVDSARRAELESIAEAERFLDTMGFGHTALEATVVDMSAMVDAARSRR